MQRCIAAILALTFLLGAGPAAAQTCDPDTEAHLEFLESRLDAGRRGATWWWRSWLTVFSIGFVYKTVDGALKHDGSNAAADFFSAGKSVLGIADLTLASHVARHGAERIRAIAKDTPEACSARLALAEKTMALAAAQGASRWSWIRHLSSLALNLAVGLAVSEGWDDRGTAWRDFGVSEVSSEVHIWSHPTRAVDDWSDYRVRFDGHPSAAAKLSLRIAAIPRGVGVRWDF